MSSCVTNPSLRLMSLRIGRPLKCMVPVTRAVLLPPSTWSSVLLPACVDMGVCEWFNAAAEAAANAGQLSGLTVGGCTKLVPSSPSSWWCACSGCWSGGKVVRRRAAAIVGHGPCMRGWAARTAANQGSTLCNTLRGWAALGWLVVVWLQAVHE